MFEVSFLQAGRSSLLLIWNLLPVGEVELVLMKFSWLGELVPVVWWMELNLVFPKVSAKFSSMFWAVHGFGITLVSLCANVQGCCPVLLKDWCGVPGTGTCWPLVVLSLSAELEVFESTFAKGSMGSRVLWWFIVLDSGLPPSGIQA